MRNLLLIFIFTSSFIHADMKELTCSGEFKNGNDETIIEKFKAIIDTNDFSKDNAKYELTWLQWTKQDYMIGKSYRNDMTVTSSIISLKYCPFHEKALKLFPGCRHPSGSTAVQSWDISRKDLKFRNGSCTIKDFISNNVL